MPAFQKPIASQEKNTRRQENIRGLADRFATILDSAFAIRGTSIRIGLDPLLGMIPVIGDYLSNLIRSSLRFLGSCFRCPANCYVPHGIKYFPEHGVRSNSWNRRPLFLLVQK